jgi:carbon storage regulator CsrA
MLVLTRKLQETIKIGDNVTIHILRVKGNTVRLGIDAPRQVRIVRGELTEKLLPADDTSAAGRDSANLPTPPAVNPVVKRGFQGAGPGLSGFFPRVLNPVSFPTPGVDATGGPVGP